MSPPPYGRRYTPINPLIGPTPRQSKTDGELPPDSSGIYVNDQTHPGLIESIFHEALAAQRIAFERALAEHLGGSKRLPAPSPIALVSLGASLLLLVGMAYVYRDLRSMMREDAAPMAPAVAPIAKRVEQTETRFDAIDERIGRLEAGVVRVLELLEPPTDVRKRDR